MKIKQTTFSSNSFQESFSLQLEPTNTVTKLLIDNFRNFPENSNFLLPRKYARRESERKIKNNKYIVTKSLSIIENELRVH